MTKERDMPTTTDPRRPIDVAPDPIEGAWCSCGTRIWGHDRHEFAAAWYGHLLAMLDADPEGDHGLEWPF